MWRDETSGARYELTRHPRTQLLPRFCSNMAQQRDWCIPVPRQRVLRAWIEKRRQRGHQGGWSAMQAAYDRHMLLKQRGFLTPGQVWFSWRLAMGQLRAWRRPTSLAPCYACKSDAVSVSHVLWRCELANAAWRRLGRAWGLSAADAIDASLCGAISSCPVEILHAAQASGEVKRSEIDHAMTNTWTIWTHVL